MILNEIADLLQIQANDREKSNEMQQFERKWEEMQWIISDLENNWTKSKISCFLYSKMKHFLYKSKIC